MMQPRAHTPLLNPLEMEVISSQQHGTTASTTVQLQELLMDRAMSCYFKCITYFLAFKGLHQ